MRDANLTFQLGHTVFPITQQRLPVSRRQ